MQGSDDQRREAFEAEMLPHLDAAYRLARALTRQEQDAEDLVQEAYLQAFRGFASYTPGTHARAWLLTIVRHAYLNGRRRERSRPQFVAMGLTEEEENVVDRTAPGPEAAALRLIDLCSPSSTWRGCTTPRRRRCSAALSAP
jgi:RNA polymerase sigma-70 factor (ECF subfamily)